MDKDWLRIAEAIWDAVKENYSDLENASKVFEIKNKLKEMQQGNLDITDYYNALQTLWQELDMHYETDWGDLKEVPSLKGISRRRGCMNSWSVLTKILMKPEGEYSDEDLCFYW